MKKLLTFLILLISVHLWAQSSVTPSGAYYFDGVNWDPFATTATAGALPAGVTPKPTYLYGYNSGTGRWVPLSSSGGGAQTNVVNTWTANQIFSNSISGGAISGNTAALPSLTGFLLGKSIYSGGSDIDLNLYSFSGSANIVAQSNNLSSFQGGPTTGSVTQIVGTTNVAGLGLSDTQIADSFLSAYNGSQVRIGPHGAPSVMQVGTQVGFTVSTITAGATPALTTAPLQTITLSAAATPTIATIIKGEHIVFQICQPSAGGPYTWAWPATIHGGMTIGTTANTCSQQAFDSFNGTTLVAENTGVVNVAP